MSNLNGLYYASPGTHSTYANGVDSNPLAGYYGAGVVRSEVACVPSGLHAHLALACRVDGPGSDDGATNERRCVTCGGGGTG